MNNTTTIETSETKDVTNEPLEVTYEPLEVTYEGSLMPDYSFYDEIDGEWLPYQSSY